MKMLIFVGKGNYLRQLFKIQIYLYFKEQRTPLTIRRLLGDHLTYGRKGVGWRRETRAIRDNLVH